MTHELFYWHGIHATGVEAVANAAEVAPTTLYRLFGSKDGLVAAYVERAGALYREWFDNPSEAQIAQRASACWACSQPSTISCSGELPRVSVPDGARGDPRRERSGASARGRPEGMGQQAIRRARTRADPAGRRPDQLTDALTLIFEGSYASAQALGAGGPARRSPDLVAAMLEPVG